MSFLAPLLPAAGLAIGGLLGGGASSAPKVNFTPPGFSAGGLNATFGGNGYNLTADAGRAGAVGGVASTFGQQASALGALGQRFAPGFSDLRTSLMSALQNNRTSALGNLRENLASRRVLGSSFAQDTLARADQEYQQNIQKAQADTYLQELSASQQIIQQQYAAARGQFQTGLDELNLEAGLAASLTSKASTALEGVAKTQAELDAKAASGAGSFFGQLGSMLGSGASKILGSSGGFSSLLGGGSAASSIASDGTALLAAL